jgi:hypothetical protein
MQEINQKKVCLSLGPKESKPSGRAAILPAISPSARGYFRVVFFPGCP